jgi:hypothetical protein
MAKRIQFQMTIGGVPVEGEILEEEIQTFTEYVQTDEFNQDLAALSRGVGKVAKGAAVVGGLALLISAIADKK